jgi:SAM-dependent methyltransferase
MAGTGRVTAELVKSGLRPTCVDSSREMLARLTSKIGSESAFVVRADVRDLPFARTFAIAILPFNAFSELVSEGDRRAALSSIREALAPRGRFICTLHNPAVRLRSVSRQPRIVAQFPDPSGCREVLVRIASEFDADRGVVTGTQTFATLADGEVRDKISVPLEFCLPSRSWFFAAARAIGFTVEALFGDYDRSEYHVDSSPFMVWCLREGAA